MTTNHPVFRVFRRLLPLLLLVLGGTGAMAQTDPPGRVASLSHMEGSVVLAPAGDTEWTDAVLNRPLTGGDRLWTDRGSRAEVHLGSAVLHVDGETFLEFTALDDQVLQASLNEGTVRARVRELAAGENFELDTPHLAFRASQPGDYRIDVDPARGTTRVAVRGGIALVYGANGEAQQLQAGQQIAFAGRNLERVQVQAAQADDAFDRWAADRSRMEDQSIAARYVPREVVGYQQLDAYGNWAQDPTYGPIWYPRVTVTDWAPYRYGRWEWIAPWGWTWIDDAPWGFAPFHYGRWAVIGSRWCWVPGRIGPRPIYSPALVAFVGGGGKSNLSIGSGRGIAWYPLAPGEAWRPTYRTSPFYVRNVNRNIVVSGNAFDAGHVHRGRAEALTGMRVEDFSRGRPVHSHWARVSPAEVARAPLATPPAMPEPRRLPGPRANTQPPAQVPGVVVGQPKPPVQSAGPIAGRPQAQVAPPAVQRREPIDPGRPAVRQAERPPVRQEEPRARDEQRRQQAQPLQLQQQEQARRDQQRDQQLQAQRQLDEQRRAQQAQLQREHALRQQQAGQERLQHQQELQQQRAAQQEHAIQQQQRAAQHEHAIQQQQQRAAQQQQQVVPPPATVQAAPPQRGEPRERGREERRSQGDEEGRGRGRGG
ncbi:MAG TPA: DUF6600 domain-containing protein [Ramlibacter sp.]|nr:DUF6600 domain-containing protein [Ramlibacter sp.]